MKGDADTPWRVFIIHGFDASPEEHWFPWLEAQLRERGIQATRLRMPDSSHPDFDRWQATMREAIGQPDEHTILVAHSLGTISVLHFASQSGAKRLGGIVLVSGFAGRIPGLSTLDGFDVDAYADRAKIDAATIHAMSPVLHHVISTNDYVVPPAVSEQLAQRLGGTVHRVPDAGHFLDREGFTELPVALQAVEDIVQGAGGSGRLGAKDGL